MHRTIARGGLLLTLGFLLARGTGRSADRGPSAADLRVEVAAAGDGIRLEHAVSRPGAYRVECWLDIDGERRRWIDSNPIHVRADR
jgi:hypothetical protein